MTMPAFIQFQCLLFSGKGGREGVGTSLAFVVTKRALHDRKLYTNKGSPSSLFSGLTFIFAKEYKCTGLVYMNNFHQDSLSDVLLNSKTLPTDQLLVA